MTEHPDPTPAPSAVAALERAAAVVATAARAKLISCVERAPAPGRDEERPGDPAAVLRTLVSPDASGSTVTLTFGTAEEAQTFHKAIHPFVCP